MADSPEPLSTLTPKTDTSYLLFCPDQGGWHVGEWWTVDGPGRWVAVIDASLDLHPAFWQPVPADPMDAIGKLQWLVARRLNTTGSA